ncbi:MAG: nucleotidyl transferase AbiEii/AbiGii toxin family protein [Gammaproteobacteria bacterium]|nr:nucleotidyl transferase AbiEii/AbiGii toxin family protein [Gammaproteobacteria bacterium]
MKNTSVNIVGRLSTELVALYADIQTHAEELNIDILVIGAMVRDLVLVYGFDADVERVTLDLDFGINVARWDEFNALKESLMEVGYAADGRILHRLTREDKDGVPRDIDIIPFGKIADQNNRISWPPREDIVMNVHGFAEAFEHALEVQISEAPDIIIPVVSPEGFALLKLVSWLDREVELRPKDATDFRYLIQNYRKIPEISDALYKKGYMEAQESDVLNASAMKLGEDVAAIASQESIKLLENELFKQPDITEEFIREMQGDGNRSLRQYAEWFGIFTKSCLGD